MGSVRGNTELAASWRKSKDKKHMSSRGFLYTERETSAEGRGRVSGEGSLLSVSRVSFDQMEVKRNGYHKKSMIKTIVMNMMIVIVIL